MMRDLLATIYLILVLFLWFRSYEKLKVFGKPALRHFRWMLILFIGLLISGFIFFLIIANNCSGHYCGLEAIIVFVLVSAAQGLLFPAVMLIGSISYFKKKQQRP